MSAYAPVVAVGAGGRGAAGAFFAGLFLAFDLRDLTKRPAFLIFCTLEREIPAALAICEPDFPACTSFFTRARVAAVMTARLWVFGTAAAFLGRPALRPFLQPPPRAADLTALRKDFTSAKPYRS